MLCLTAVAFVTFMSVIRAQTGRVYGLFDNERRLLFDVDGNQLDAYGAKMYCKKHAPPRKRRFNPLKFSVLVS
jgi:hypothetical protein